MPGAKPFTQVKIVIIIVVIVIVNRDGALHTCAKHCSERLVSIKS